MATVHSQEEVDYVRRGVWLAQRRGDAERVRERYKAGSVSPTVLCASAALRAVLTQGSRCFHILSHATLMATVHSQEEVDYVRRGVWLAQRRGDAERECAKDTKAGSVGPRFSAPPRLCARFVAQGSKCLPRFYGGRCPGGYPARQDLRLSVVRCSARLMTRIAVSAFRFGSSSFQIRLPAELSR